MSEAIVETLHVRPGKAMRVLRYGVFTLLVLSVAGIGVKVMRQSAEIATLQTALGQVPGRDAVQQELDRLGEQVNHNRETLTALSASLEKVKAVPAVDKPAFEQLAQQVRQLETKVSQPVPSDSQPGLQATMALLQARVEVLEQRAAGTTAAQPAASVATPTVKKTASRRASARTMSAPFRLTSIERRGGTVFVAVAPLQAFNLADIRLMETGETFQGWTLLSAAGNQAQFSVAGRTQTLSVQ